MRFKLKHAAVALLALITGGILATSGSIGVTVGPTVGERVGVAVGVSENPLGGAALPLIIIIGDSNGAGKAGQIASNPPADSSSPGLATFATQSAQYVYFDSRVDTAVDNPPSYITNTGGVQPYSFNGDLWMGPEITIGQELTRQGVSAVLQKVAIVGLACAQMVPSPSPAYPTSGPSWFNLMTAQVHAVEAARGSLVQIAVVFADNNDGLSAGTSAAVAANNSAFAAGLASAFPGLRAIIWAKINSDTVNFPGFIAATITNQTTWFTNNPTVSGVPIIPVWWDDLLLQTDHAHGTPATYLTLGQRIAWLALDALGRARPRPSPAPAIVGYGPTFAANGTTQPSGWGGAQAGDLEILLDVQMVGSGTEGSTTTPSGWTSRGSVVSSNGSPGFQTRLVTYSRVVDSTMISGNHGNTALTSVVMDAPNTVHWSQILTVRGPNANPTIDFVQLTGANATTSSYTLTGGTTTHPFELIIPYDMGYPSPQGTETTTITNSTVAGLAALKSGTQACPDGNIALGDTWSSTLAAATATGNFPVTLSTSNICPAGGVIAIAP